MTLGGLALAVGVLVDEATVEIENIHTQMLPGVSRARAVVEACSRTAMARLLSMFCILAVFVPSFFMVGVSRQLFVPLSLAVGFSMIASYLLSSSLVPVFSTWLMREAHRGEEHGLLRSLYERYLTGVLRLRWPLAIVYLASAFGVLYVLLPHMGTELFPDANAPLLRMRLRAPAGTRIEETERIVLHALDVIGMEAGKENIAITSDFLGLIPSSYPVDLIHLFTSGPQDAIIQVSLKPDAPARRSPARTLTGQPAARVARYGSFLRGGRYRHAGDELRLADARRSRRAGHQSAGRLRLRAKNPGISGEAELHPRPSDSRRR